MIDKKYSSLQRAIAESKKREKNLQKRISVWRERSIEDRKLLRDMVVSYERVIRERKIIFDDLIKNWWKIVFVKIRNKIKKLRGEVI